MTLALSQDCDSAACKICWQQILDLVRMVSRSGSDAVAAVRAESHMSLQATVRGYAICANTARTEVNVNHDLRAAGFVR